MREETRPKTEDWLKDPQIPVLPYRASEEPEVYFGETIGLQTGQNQAQ